MSDENDRPHLDVSTARGFNPEAIAAAEKAWANDPEGFMKLHDAVDAAQPKISEWHAAPDAALGAAIQKAVNEAMPTFDAVTTEAILAIADARARVLLAEDFPRMLAEALDAADKRRNAGGLSSEALVASDLPRVIEDALDASDRRREERTARHAVTQNLEGTRAKFAEQLKVLERVSQITTDDEPLATLCGLVDQSIDLLRAIDTKLAGEVAKNAPMIAESIRQHRAALEPESAPRIELLPGAALIAQHGKRR